MLSRKAT